MLFCQVFQVINSLSYHYNFKLSHLTEILSVVLAKRGPESVSSAAKVNHYLTTFCFDRLNSEFKSLRPSLLPYCKGRQLFTFRWFILPHLHLVTLSLTFRKNLVLTITVHLDPITKPIRQKLSDDSRIHTIDQVADYKKELHREVYKKLQLSMSRCDAGFFPLLLVMKEFLR